IHVELHQIQGKGWEILEFACVPPIFDEHILAFGISEGAQTLAKRLPFRAVGGAENTNPPYLASLLRLSGERRGKYHRTRASEERPSIHYWMTSSARPSTDGGIVRPRALAVLRLMTNSNFVGCSTGKSAGLAPLRILSTYVAARRNKEERLAP